MSLPQLRVPEDTITLFSQKKPVKIRPYLVGEEKILLMAQQAEEQDKNGKEIEKAVKQIIERCTFGTVEVNTLPSFDVEYLFLQLRAKSVSNVIESHFRCKNQVPIAPVGSGTPESEGMKPCDASVPVNIDINDIHVTVPEGHNNHVMLDDTIGVTLRYPTAEIHDALLKSGGDLSVGLLACLETIYTKDEVFEVKEQSSKELQEFVDTLSLTQVEKIRTTFFDSMPRLQYKFTFTCPKCGYSEDVVLQGLTDFFD